MQDQLYLHLNDEEWPFTYIDHVRQIARAVVIDDEEYFYFVRVRRDDAFGIAALIETSGGGIEENETPEEAVCRELNEELGADVNILCSLGVVEDDYNLIHRHNVNHYFLCRVRSLGLPHLTQQEAEAFHLSVLRLHYAEAEAEYRKCASSALGRLIAQRELPILQQAGRILGITK